jgi:cytochrome P450
MAISALELDLPTFDGAISGVYRVGSVDAARDQHWLARSPIGFALTRHEDAVAVLRDRRFHSGMSLIPAMQGMTGTFLENRRPSLLEMEGDDHTRLRRLVTPALNPASADRLRPFMRETVDGLLDSVSGEGRCEFVASVAEPYPIPVICRLLGAPPREWPRMARWAPDILRLFNQNLAEDLPVIQQAVTELETYLRSLTEERRDEPGDDLLSALIAAGSDQDRLTTDDILVLAGSVVVAGIDTTQNQLACSVALLLSHADEWARFVAHPERAPQVAEETMRYLCTVQGMVRVASEDIEYRGVLFPRGTLLNISLRSLNWDPDVFPSPEQFDPTRDPKRSTLTFGSGIHYCLGSHLARAELQEALTTLARRMPDLALDGPVEWKPETFGIWGPARLPVRWGV